MKIFTATLFILFGLNAFSQNASENDYYNNAEIRYEDKVYVKHIASVQLHLEDWELSQPVIKLNSNEILKLSFDDLSALQKDYYYTIIHCNADWKPSGLFPSEYINGVPEDFIFEYKYSTNTYVKYIHYNLKLPNDNMNISKSGNYVLIVYEPGQKNTPVLTRRFFVLENKIMLKATINRATTIADRNYKQEIDFTILSDKYQLINPYSDLKVVLKQNGRWDNAVTSLKPLFVKDKELVYDYDTENVFNGGSEYRYFDLKGLNNKTDRIDYIAYEDSLKHAYLTIDEKRTYRVYSSYGDINGKRVIRIEGNFDSEVDADYLWVHFFLKYPYSTDGDLYIMGALSDWNFHPDYKMKYNKQEDLYETKVLLKQGYYNYEYVMLKDSSTVADNSPIEGMHWETENDYYIYVYHRSMGDAYDRLIGYEVFNSVRTK